MFKIAIIGRPNVGKSTFFNKLVGRSIAITDDMPGVTRDRKESRAKLGPLEFIAIDTAGLENEINNASLEERMVAQTEAAVADADLCLFVVDGKNGVASQDFYFAQWLRKIDKKVILIANKCENLNGEFFDSSYYKLGFGKPTAVSAEHKLGFGELYEKIAPEIEKYEEMFAEVKEQDSGDVDEEEKDLTLQIAIAGRPNAGKSTFLNKILNEERLIVGPEAGITRDAIAIDHNFHGKIIRFIDTAGIRKKANIIQKLEKLSTIDSFRAIRFAQVVILLLDANALLDHQDMALAGEILREGRGLIFAINKIDSIKKDKEVFMREVRQQIQSLFPEIEGAPIIGISAKSGYNVEKTVEYALKTYEQWQTYIQTNKLHDWLKFAETNHTPKLYHGKSVKLKYATQIKKRPPTFAVFTNHIKPLEGAYQRYLVNSLREHFDLKLTPVRLVFRKSDNPFEGKKEKTFSKKLHKNKK
jgi:GTP-binding protein